MEVNIIISYFNIMNSNYSNVSYNVYKEVMFFVWYIIIKLIITKISSKIVAIKY